MHPQQLKKKAHRGNSSSFTRRTFGSSNSYLKTRIRGPRLLNPARVLLLLELTQRLHQALTARLTTNKRLTGCLTAETFGNSFVHSVAYNRRLQPKQVKLTLGGTEQQRFDYLYGTVTQSNGLVDVTKNNGQIGRIDGYITGVRQWDQRLSYDSLGRLFQATEYRGDNGLFNHQAFYDYDRYGNRFQYQQNINVPYTPVQPTDIEQSPHRNRFKTTGPTPVSYDAAGNMIMDAKFRLSGGFGMNYSYDANNRQVKSERTNQTNVQTSVYDAIGQRVQTTANGVARQMVYDAFGQIIAEYKNGTLERENIYRSGQLLATQESAEIVWTNAAGVSVSGNTITKTAPTGWGNAGAVSAQAIVSGDGYVEFTADQISYRMFGLSNGDSNQNYPDIDFALYPGADYNLSIYEGGTWKASVGTYAVGDRLRVAVEGGVVRYRKNGVLLYTSSVAPVYPLLVDTSLYPSGGTLTNVVMSASATNLAVNKPATQSSTHHAITTAAKAVDGNTNGALWDGFSSATNYENNAWWQVDLGSVQALSLIQVWGRSDCCTEMTSNFYLFVSDNPFTSYDLNTTLNQPGVSNYYVAGYSGRPGTINVNRTGRYVRVQFAAAQYLVLAEVQIWDSIANSSGLKYVLQDVQGSTRAVMNNNGSGSGIIVRHDFLPFGEEIGSGTGMRTAAQGFGATDKIRQRYALTERDDSSGLDHTWWRKYESYSGRWTTADPYRGSMTVGDPQSFNRYSYVQNDPTNFVDPLGLCLLVIQYRAVEGTITILDAYTILCNGRRIPTRQVGGGPDGRGGPIGIGALGNPGLQTRFGRKDKEERCRKAVEEAQRASDAIERRFANAIRAGGLDAGHQKAIEQSLNQLKNAMEAIDKNCFDGPGGPPVVPELEKQINDLRQKASEYKVPPIGWDGGRTAAERRIKGAALVGNLGGVVGNVLVWFLRLRWGF